MIRTCQLDGLRYKFVTYNGTLGAVADILSLLPPQWQSNASDTDTDHTWAQKEFQLFQSGTSSATPIAKDTYVVVSPQGTVELYDSTSFHHIYKVVDEDDQPDAMWGQCELDFTACLPSETDDHDVLF